MTASRTSLYMWLATAMLTSFAATGCSTDPPAPSPEDGDFLSDNPARPSYGGPESNDSGSTGSGSDDDSGSGGGGNVAPDPVAEPDPERLISEADIIQMDGDILYALSRFSGLSVIDLSNPDNPQLLGNESLGGEPFEMYRDDNSIIAMFNGWGHYVALEDGGWEWATTSHVVVLDVTNSTNIQEIGSFDLPGQIADSRRVGDILYTVTFESGWCWECQPEPNTTVSSFDLSDLAHPVKVDQAAILDTGYDYGWQRSISVNDQRIYIGGVEWDWDDDGSSSSIDIVDISDPSGHLELGTSVKILGHINSRWQMDEHEGVLRVVSQPWNTSVYPRVETFQVTSSHVVTPLGSTEIITPIPESLRAVRFDGDRAFAITAEQTDPLYTIDLSNAAAPIVTGFLEIPGWVYHIEPRGDRLLALGFDNSVPNASLNVSLFDVSDMANPTLRKRVHFGGDWSNFAEDQDRVHKSFKILADLGLLLVPYSGYEWSENGCGGYDSGVQLIDWANDDLTLRGVAPIRGQARRAFIHDNRLFALSDEQLRSFDIADRDSPDVRGQLQLSATVSQVAVSGDHVVRLSADWWTTEPRLEIVSANDASAVSPIGSLDLGPLLASVENDPSCYGWSYWGARMFVHGTNVALIWPSWNGSIARLVTIDISDPTAPRFGGRLDLPLNVFQYGYWVGMDVVSTGDTIAQIGSKLAIQELVSSPTSYYITGARVRIVDISNVDDPVVLSTVQLPAGSGYTGLVAQGSRFLLSHWEDALDFPGKVRFYLDRIDTSIPSHPIQLEKINIPGSLVTLDPASSNLVTVDYQRRYTMTTSQDCYEHGYDASFEIFDENDPNVWGDETGRCSFMERRLQLSHLEDEDASVELLETLPMPKGYLSELRAGDNRIFFSSNHYTYDYETGNSEYIANLHVIGGIREGSLENAQVSLDDTWWVSPVGVDGQTLFGMSWPGAMVTLETSDMTDIQVTKIGEMPWWVQHVKVHEDKVYLSLGQYGLEVIDL